MRNVEKANQQFHAVDQLGELDGPNHATKSIAISRFEAKVIMEYWLRVCVELESRWADQQYTQAFRTRVQAHARQRFVDLIWSGVTSNSVVPGTADAIIPKDKGSAECQPNGPKRSPRKRRRRGR